MNEKERLEKIKEVHLERIKQNEFYTASFIHVDWLIEQAEKVQQLEEEIENLKQQRDLARSAPFYQCPNCMKKFDKHRYLENMCEEE